MFSYKRAVIIVVFLLCVLMLISGCSPQETVTANPSVSQAPPVYDVTGVAKSDDGYYTCDYNGVTRKFVLYIPEGAGKGSPLVFMMHGYSSSAKGFMDFTGMNETADKYGYAVVYPQGISDKRDKTSGACWNSGITDSPNDDSGFLAALARYLQQTYGFSSSETFAAGFSNGAFMSYRLACDEPGTFRAVASVAGTMSGRLWDERKASASVSILQINGTKDAAVPVDGSMSKTGGFGNAPDIYGIIEYWKNANNLDICEKVKISDRTSAYEYSSLKNDNLVWYVEIEGYRHSWPVKDLAGFSANELILEFFSKFVK